MRKELNNFAKRADLNNPNEVKRAIVLITLNYGCCAYADRSASFLFLLERKPYKETQIGQRIEKLK